MISGSTVWNFIRNVWDLIAEGYWSTTEAIARHPQITFWVLLGLAVTAFI